MIFWSFSLILFLFYLFSQLFVNCWFIIRSQCSGETSCLFSLFLTTWFFRKLLISFLILSFSLLASNQKEWRVVVFLSSVSSLSILLQHSTLSKINLKTRTYLVVWVSLSVQTITHEMLEVLPFLASLFVCSAFSFRCLLLFAFVFNHSSFDILLLVFFLFWISFSLTLDL